MTDLAEIDDFTPLVLADGTVIDPMTRKREAPAYVEVPTNTEAQRVITQTKRKLDDLPDVPARMNTIGLVLSYHMFGLSDDEIGVATGMRTEQIVNIKMLEPFADMQKAVTEQIIARDKGVVSDVIESAAIHGANKVISLMHGAEDEGLQFKAAQDVLDRSGHRPADVLEVRHSMANSLKIEHIIRSDEAQAPVIDVTPIEVIEDGNCSE